MVRAPEDKWRNEKFQGDHLHEIVPLPTAPGDWRDLFFPPRTPRTFGGGPRPLALLAAGAGFVASAPAEVVVSPGASTLVAVEESAALEKVAALPPVSTLAAGAAAEVVELCSASPPPPSSGVWGPAPQ
jgi:hypothetical protein